MALLVASKSYFMISLIQLNFMDNVQVYSVPYLSDTSDKCGIDVMGVVHPIIG